MTRKTTNFCVSNNDEPMYYSENFWSPCEKCKQTEILGEHMTVRDLNYCLANCQAKKKILSDEKCLHQK